MKLQLTSGDLVSLIQIGLTTVGQILAARKAKQLAEASPEVAGMTQAEFDAAFGAYYAAEDTLAAQAAALVEAGAADKAGGGQ